MQAYQVSTKGIPQYITDGDGKKIAVILDLQFYQQLLEQLEELESIQAYDLAMAENDQTISFEMAIAEIEKYR